jgi:hypothetical protein
MRSAWVEIAKPGFQLKNHGAIWRAIFCPLSAESRLLSGMIAADPCPELQELKRQYGSALRIWARYEFPQHNEPVGTRAQRLEHLRLKQKAVEERNAANDRLLDHERICLLCAGKAG